ncbi:glycosyltransferase family 2 protein [Bacillus mobilis]|uniref:glycosyltransferase family 2 protein n=1 Tax=Bacillus mobilis TaxID=2026190 RepID=UPI0021CDB6AE|nr:glycosyltransferase family 2 protein [Bacillus mobilis]MCU5433795.1 glycosyltransferase family 2 protein [Bacillus mobilis]
MNIQPKVAIIILNWNSYNDTSECLESLGKMHYKNYHVFLADNDSKDGSFESLKKEYQENKYSSNITFIQTGSNLGFAGGNNVAIKKAYENGFDYFWLLNNDTVVEENALIALIENIDKSPEIGIVGSKIYYYGTNKIWFAGGKVSTSTGVAGHIGLRAVDNGQFDKVESVDYITGCSLLFRREILETVGYMNEDYFLLFEETEWNIRIKQKGYKILYIPDSIIYHKVSISSGGENNIAPYAAYYEIRNGYVMVDRTQPSYYKIPAFCAMLFKAMKKHVKILLHGQDKKFVRSKYILLGVIHGIQKKMGKHPNY